MSTRIHMPVLMVLSFATSACAFPAAPLPIFELWRRAETVVFADVHGAKTTMRKDFVRRGRHWVMPIVGDSEAEICISVRRSPEIIIEDANGHESIIELADRFGIGRGSDMRTVDSNCDIFQSPLLELLGAAVTVATACEDGSLELEFSNAMRIEICSTTGFEAWHFQYPRPGRAVAGDLASHIALHGADGRLIGADQ